MGVDRKKEILKRYMNNLQSVEQIKFFNQNLEFTTPWFIDVLVEERENLISFLKESKISTRIMYPPINKQKAYNVEGEHSVSNLVGEKGLWLPSASQLRNEDIDKVTTKIVEFYNK
jgi:perosamine synthetase